MIRDHVARMGQESAAKILQNMARDYIELEVNPNNQMVEIRDLQTTYNKSKTQMDQGSIRQIKDLNQDSQANQYGVHPKWEMDLMESMVLSKANQSSLQKNKWENQSKQEVLVAQIQPGIRFRLADNQPVAFVLTRVCSWRPPGPFPRRMEENQSRRIDRKWHQSILDTPGMSPNLRRKQIYPSTNEIQREYDSIGGIDTEGIERRDNQGNAEEGSKMNQPLRSRERIPSYSGRQEVPTISWVSSQRSFLPIQSNVLWRKTRTAGLLQDSTSCHPTNQREDQDKMHCFLRRSDIPLIEQRRSGMLKDRNNSNTLAVLLEDIRKEICARLHLNPAVLELGDRLKQRFDTHDRTEKNKDDKSNKKMEQHCLKDDECEGKRTGKLHRSIKLLEALDTKRWPSYEEAEQGQTVCRFELGLEQQSLLEQRYPLRDILVEEADRAEYSNQSNDRRTTSSSPDGRIVEQLGCSAEVTQSGVGGHVSG
ncbi:MAG: hypothetical protein EZS28_009532 [Streblomastix strix]|uniref:Uncharacterized protein n=1 Tax=Streblomastix strix TaxID=222440 RepID=A0A5J4WIX5_9EUKA|nr:MAG: hypothetical protein EZS28_009532 [Streblomastix strix]